MNEQCAGCPWLDEPKKQCRRTPPRFCSLDESDSKRSGPEKQGAGDTGMHPTRNLRRGPDAAAA
jgi:hypothetical protein